MSCIWHISGTGVRRPSGVAKPLATSRVLSSSVGQRRSRHPAQGEHWNSWSVINRSLPTLAVLAVEVLSECVEALAEERSELVDPAHDILQRLRVELV
jgi:hypothetical protein